jgi:exodeoxyribonuclease-3
VDVEVLSQFKHMKIVTWNVNSIKARLEIVLKWLKNYTPDVMLLQELKVINEAFPYEPIENLGYNIAIHGEKKYNGVAIISKMPIYNIHRQLPGNEDKQARYIEARVGPIRVASVYVPNGQEIGSEKFTYKLAFLNRLYAHTKRLLSQEEIFVLGGDYNIALEDADVYNPISRAGTIHCSTEERNCLRKSIYLGLTDAIRIKHPVGTPSGTELYTWWDYRAGSWQKNQGMRLDHLFLSPLAADRFVDAGVDTKTRGLPKPSDHAPTWCVLKI